MENRALLRAALCRGSLKAKRWRRSHGIRATGRRARVLSYGRTAQKLRTAPAQTEPTPEKFAGVVVIERESGKSSRLFDWGGSAMPEPSVESVGETNALVIVRNFGREYFDGHVLGLSMDCQGSDTDRG